MYTHLVPMLANASATLGGVEVSAMFADAYTTSHVGDFGVASSSPMLTLATTDVPAAPIAQAVVVNGKAYVVKEHQPNGSGLSVLLLEESV